MPPPPRSGCPAGSYGCTSSGRSTCHHLPPQTTSEANGRQGKLFGDPHHDRRDLDGVVAVADQGEPAVIAHLAQERAQQQQSPVGNSGVGQVDPSHAGDRRVLDDGNDEGIGGVEPQQIGHGAEQVGGATGGENKVGSHTPTMCAGRPNRHLSTQLPRKN